jgi:hypothetical protein
VKPRLQIGSSGNMSRIACAIAQSLDRLEHLPAIVRRSRCFGVWEGSQVFRWMMQARFVVLRAGRRPSANLTSRTDPSRIHGPPLGLRAEQTYWSACYVSLKGPPSYKYKMSVPEIYMIRVGGITSTSHAHLLGRNSRKNLHYACMSSPVSEQVP